MGFKLNSQACRPVLLSLLPPWLCYTSCTLHWHNHTSDTGSESQPHMVHTNVAKPLSCVASREHACSSYVHQEYWKCFT